jgi:hypothetical protein
MKTTYKCRCGQNLLILKGIRQIKCRTCGEVINLPAVLEPQTRTSQSRRFSPKRILSIIILTGLGLLVLALVDSYLRIAFLILILLSSIIWLASKSSVYWSSKILKNILDGLRGWLIILFAAWIVAAFFSASYSIKDASLQDPFKDHVREYSTVSGLKNSVRTSPHRTQAYLKGKIITVNKKENRIDDIYFKLPEELRATKPEDVGTIVWLDWGEDRVGFYLGSHGDATVNTCHVTIIDKSVPAIVGEINFRGSDPPERSYGSSSGSMPTEVIVNYLRNLPKK